MPVAGLTGLATLGLGGSAEEAGQDIGKMQDALTYHPRTEGGKATEQAYGEAMGGLHEGFNKAGEFAQDHLGGTLGMLAATGAASTPDIMQLLGGREPLEALPHGITWDSMTGAEARAFAAADQHLSPSRGQNHAYRGAPDTIQSKRDLNTFRRKLDKAIAEGADIDIGNGVKAKDWYPDAQKSIASITKDPTNAQKLADVTGVYSAHKSVPQNVDLALKHHTLEALKSNDEAVAAMPGDKTESAKAGAIMAGAQGVPTGNKIMPFSDAINPFNTKEPNRSVNDTRMLDFFGYTNKGIQAPQHSFITGEMHAALDRAIKKGTLPPEANVHSAQASAWATIAGRGGGDSAKGLGAFFNDHAANVTYEPGAPGAPGHMEGLNDEPMTVRREHAANMAWAQPGQTDPLYDAVNIPNKGTTEGLGNWASTRADKPPFEAAIMDPKTGEEFTGAGRSNMHFDAMLRMPADSIARFDEHPEAFPNGFLDPKGEFLTRGETHDAAQALSSQDPNLKRAGNHFGADLAASEDFRGAQRGEVQRIEHNPLNVAHPMGAWDDPNFNDLLKQVETFRGTVDAQQGVGWNRVTPMPVNKNGFTPANALKIELGKDHQLSELESRSMYREGRRQGLNLIDNGDGGYTMTGPEWADTDPHDFWTKLGRPQSENMRDFSTGATPGTLESEYHPLPWGKDVRNPEGTATANLLEAINPKVGAALHTPKISELLLNKNKAEVLADMQSAGARKSGPSRSIHNLRATLAEHGVEGLREKVSNFAADNEISFTEAAAKLGLPAALIANALGGNDETPR